MVRGHQSIVDFVLYKKNSRFWLKHFCIFKYPQFFKGWFCWQPYTPRTSHEEALFLTWKSAAQWCMVSSPMAKTIALVNQISQLLLPIATPHFGIKECFSLKKHFLMFLQIDWTIVTVIDILSTSHGERNNCSQCITAERMGRITSSSLWMTATSHLSDIEIGV